jgi:hypothetical protein
MTMRLHSFVDRPLAAPPEVILIEGESYRLMQASTRADQNAALRRPARTKPAMS